jgi:hypothetical protein
MKTTLTAALLVAAASLAAPGAAAIEEGNCNNYGIAVNTYVQSPPDCSSHEYVQYCDQGTGAGAGAGAGSGAGNNQAEAEASAGTRCEQNNQSNRTNGAGGPVLDMVPGIGTANALIEHFGDREALDTSLPDRSDETEERPPEEDGGTPRREAGEASEPTPPGNTVPAV